MIIISIQFCLFLTAVLALYLLCPARYRWFILLTASFYFYGHRTPINLLFLVLPTLLIYIIGHLIRRSTRPPVRKRWFLLGIVLSASSLVGFKYGNFIGQNLTALAGLWVKDLVYHPMNLLLPMGISFFTFKLISYLIEVYRGNIEPERHLGYFALYVSFFPQILAGPIERAGKFIPELRKKVRLNMDMIASGFRLASWGLFKKMVVADRLAVFIGEVYKDPHDQGLNLVICAYFYAFQIYCDFSGYSDMAIGITRMFGFKSTLNFDFPYFSRSMTEFWSRWHISLSTWLRDYLFLPIAYAVMRPIKSSFWLGIKAETWGYAIGMSLTMFLGGLWHGASWTFVIWGLLHGTYLLVGYATKKARKRLVKRIGLNRWPRLRHALSILITFNLVSFAWIFFRSESFEKAYHYIDRITLKMSTKGLGYLIFNTILILGFLGLEYLYKHRSEIPFIKAMHPYLKTTVYAVFIVITLILAVDKSNEFIYFQF